jgi:hypothetical protein
MHVEVATTTSADVLVDHETEPVGVISSGPSFEDVHLSRFFGFALQLNRPSTVDRCTFSEIESTAIRFARDSQSFTIYGSMSHATFIAPPSEPAAIRVDPHPANEPTYKLSTLSQ